jgi:tripeptidyl-peptidase-1
MALAEPLPVTDIQVREQIGARVEKTNELLTGTMQVGDKFLRGTLNTMLSGFDRHYCKTALDPDMDPIYPDSKNPGGYNASDCGNRKPPLVISISWAQPEAELPERYLRRQCVEFLKLGLQGVTVLAASGDTGPASSQGTCIDPETGSLNTTRGMFSPNFPASCPWVTAVGGSQLSPANQTWTPGVQFPPETAFTWENPTSEQVATSGGGFSRVFKTPPYQSAAVRSYVRDGVEEERLANLSAAGYFNPTGRGYPDLSAMANGYLVYVVGQLHKIYGTSAATPVVASMIARINDARMHLGKGPVGFINPVLYAHAPEFMRDVKTGYSQGCGVAQAYAATKGWDAVTGLGTLDFQKLLQFYLGLP